MGSADTVVSSSDAVHWSALATGLGDQERTADYNSVCFGLGQFVAVANNGQGINQVVTSTDGLHWTLAASTPSQPLFQTYYNWNQIVFGNGRFAVMGNGTFYALTFSGPGGELLSSPDATHWVAYQDVTLGSVSGLSFGLGQFVASSTVGSLLTSPDAMSWTYSGHFGGINTGGACAGRDPHGNDVLAQTGSGDQVAIVRNVGATNENWQFHFAPGIYNINSDTPERHKAIAYGPNPAGIGTFVAFSGSNIVTCVVYPGPYYWTNTMGGNWSNPSNWSPNEVPDVGDDVVIAAPGTYTVNLDTPVARNLNSLTLGAGVAGGTQTVVLSGATFSPNLLVITNGGALSVDNSSTISGTITIAAGCGLLLNHNSVLKGELTVAADGVLTADACYLNGNITIAAGGELHTVNNAPNLGATGSLSILPGGRFDLDAYLYVYGPITNAGTIELNDSNWINIYNNGQPDNQGAIVNLPTGTIHLNGATSYQPRPPA